MEKAPISILAVDDEETLLHTLVRILEQNGYYVDTAADGEVAINMLQTLPFDIVLLDLMMPKVNGMEVLSFIRDQHLDTETIMLTAVHDVKTVVECMRMGAYYYITKPYHASDLLALLDRALERKRLLIQNKALRQQLAHHALPSTMISENKAMLNMLQLALTAASTGSPILIQGASGTGKDVLANFLHKNSGRSDQALLGLNCVVLLEAQLDEELFGLEKNPASNVKIPKQGLLEMANGGTLLLDEIGELPPAVQTRLLEFLQTGQFHRNGGHKTLKSDVRLISTTSSDLPAAVREGRFSEDLLTRTNVITLKLPELRGRKDDIPLLAEQFLRDQAGTRMPKTLNGEALELLKSYDWPGNVRELEGVVKRAAMVADGDIITAVHLGLPSGVKPRPRPARKPKARSHPVKVLTIEQVQKAHVKSVLASVKGDTAKAAKVLGVRVKALDALMKKLKIRRRAR